MSDVLTGTASNIGQGKSATVTALTNNGAGLVRVTTSAPHLFGPGDTVQVRTGVVAGEFTIKVIDSERFDLLGSTFTATSTGVAVDMCLTPQVLLPTDGDPLSMQVSGLLSAFQHLLDRTQMLALFDGVLGLVGVGAAEGNTTGVTGQGGPYGGKGGVFTGVGNNNAISATNNAFEAPTAAISNTGGGNCLDAVVAGGGTAVHAQGNGSGSQVANAIVGLVTGGAGAAVTAVNNGTGDAIDASCNGAGTAVSATANGAGNAIYAQAGVGIAVAATSSGSNPALTASGADGGAISAASSGGGYATSSTGTAGNTGGVYGSASGNAPGGEFLGGASGPGVKAVAGGSGKPSVFASGGPLYLASALAPATPVANSVYSDLVVKGYGRILISNDGLGTASWVAGHSVNMPTADPVYVNSTGVLTFTLPTGLSGDGLAPCSGIVTTQPSTGFNLVNADGTVSGSTVTIQVNSMHMESSSNIGAGVGLVGSEPNIFAAITVMILGEQ